MIKGVVMRKESERLSFASLAIALASDYLSIYVINTEDDSYIEYRTDGVEKELVQVDEGEDFYADVRKNCREQVWPEDQEFFLKQFTKEYVMGTMEEGKSFSFTYRLIIEGKPKYFFLKTIRAGENNIVIGVRDVDETKRRELEMKAESETYSQIAGALASRYEVIYHINIDTNEYVQYSSSEQYALLGTTKNGADFFADSASDISIYIHPEDVDRMLEQLKKENLLRELRETGSVTFSYRQFLGDEYQYMNMIVVRPRNDEEHIVVGVININAQVQREELIAKESRTFSDISMALAQQYEVIYRVNIVDNEYSEYTANEKYARLNLGAKGENFFEDTQKNMQTGIYVDDYPMMSAAMERENFLRSISSFGKVLLNYRLMIDGRPQYATLFAVQSREDPDYIIVAVANVDAAKRMEIAYNKAMDIANKDALTSVKNKRAYVQAEVELDSQIEKKVQPPFAVVVCDINGLKQVNDIQGHKAGDEFIKDSCSIICNIFSHSPVFRIGGDEFAVLLKGRDYENRRELIVQLGDAQEDKRVKGIKPIAVGLSDFNPDKDMRVQDVFERADSLMYDDKKRCKSEGIVNAG